ncbi:hypothetical protein JTE90_022400 [Oedothorax gibbosus]|uniref:Uncharacterized protein n=1 Tax=Oedothorax gibbosus TaxID=931172 RepID=A0AAV6TYQ4_9ARAC|nr:hypothetical protein JTE90_022400 [Oedothorax gibbosus]
MEAKHEGYSTGVVIDTLFEGHLYKTPLLKKLRENQFSIVPDGGDTPDIEFFAEPCPQIHLSGNVTSGCYTIFCEGHELSTCQDFINALCLLMSYYYTLNVEFPKKALNTMTFVKCVLLKIVDGSIPPKGA